MSPVPSGPSLRRFMIWYTYNRILITAGGVGLLASSVALGIHLFFPHTVPAWLIWVPFFGGLGLTFLITRDVSCPACQRCFYGNRSTEGWSRWNIFSRKCPHCGYVPPGGGRSQRDSS